MKLRTTAQIELLYQVTRELTSTLDLEEVLNRVLAVTVETLGAERGAFFLLDAAGDIAKQIPDRPEAGDDAAPRAAPVVMAKGLAGWAMRNRKVALAADTHTDARWLSFPGDEEKIGSALAVPLIHQQQVNGLLTLLHSQRGFFTQDHAALAKAIAGQAAVAVENARLHSATQQERSALHSLISGLPEPTLLVDTAGRVTFVNQAATRILGDEMVGQPLVTLMPHQDIARMVTQATTTGQPQRMEIEWEDRRVFDTSFAPLPGLGVTVCMHDITRLKQLDQMKSQLVATVSHDIRNPLALIQGFAEVLILEEKLSKDARSCVEGILYGTERMRRLVDSLLNLEYVEAMARGEMEVSEAAAVLSQVVADMRPWAARKKQNLTADLPTSLPLLQIDPVLLGQATKNLLGNAVKYTQEGGHIHIEAEAQDDGVIVRVQDNGPGIPKQAQERLFEKFYQVGIPATLGKEGVGLGLSIVRAIAENCSGRVGVESEEGKGSTFWFWLPAAESQ